MKSILVSITCAALYCLTSVVPAFAQDNDQIIRGAIDNPARAERNKNRDELRKPFDVVKLMGTSPGMTVLDLYSDGSYYTEILASVVGEEGRIIAHMFPGNGMDPDDATTTYIRNSDHLKNVVPIYGDINDLDFKENSLDQIYIIQFYHDVYYRPLNIDKAKFLALFHKALKPGGIVAIVDHEAQAGAPASVGDTLHRIDPELVKSDMQEAGFVFEGQSDVLINDTDDKSISVFDDSVRGKTSRIIMKFSSP